MLKTQDSCPVSAFIRIRPLLPRERAVSPAPAAVAVDGGVSVTLSSRDVLEQHQYTFNGFDGVFDSSATQEDVYELVAAPVVAHVVGGVSGCIMAYGGTCAGKSYTLFGHESHDAALAGCAPRAITDLFNAVASIDGAVVTCSAVELYLDHARDLLADNCPRAHLLPDGPLLAGVSEHVCDTASAAASLLRLASARRCTAPSTSNTVSSRSHCIFAIHIHAGSQRASLALVDLAGSEKVSRTGSVGQRLQEAKRINAELHELGQVVTALAEGRGAHVPYRNCTLTQALRPALGGAAVAVLVANISPASADADTSLSTLRFAVRIQGVLNYPARVTWVGGELGGSQWGGQTEVSVGDYTLRETENDLYNHCEALKTENEMLIRRIEQLTTSVNSLVDASPPTPPPNMIIQPDLPLHAILRPRSLARIGRPAAPALARALGTASQELATAAAAAAVAAGAAPSTLPIIVASAAAAAAPAGALAAAALAAAATLPPLAGAPAVAAVAELGADGRGLDFAGRTPLAAAVHSGGAVAAVAELGVGHDVVDLASHLLRCGTRPSDPAVATIFTSAARTRPEALLTAALATGQRLVTEDALDVLVEVGADLPAAAAAAVAAEAVPAATDPSHAARVARAAAFAPVMAQCDRSALPALLRPVLRVAETGFMETVAAAAVAVAGVHALAWAATAPAVVEAVHAAANVRQDADFWTEKMSGMTIADYLIAINAPVEGLQVVLAAGAAAGAGMREMMPEGITRSAVSNQAVHLEVCLIAVFNQMGRAAGAAVAGKAAEVAKNANAYDSEQIARKYCHYIQK